MPSKSILLSKMMWFNVLFLVFYLANPWIGVVEPAVLDSVAVVTLPLANAVLRYVTKGAVHVRPVKD